MDIETRYEEIMDSANASFSAACILDGRDRTGVYVCVANSSGFLEVRLIGTITDRDMAARCLINCQEKAKRLLANKNHVSSFQTRDIDDKLLQKKYAGSVRCDTGEVISASGFTENVDEAYCSKIGFDSRILGATRWRLIAGISQNPFMRMPGVLG